jgi:hypothetical protein
MNRLSAMSLVVLGLALIGCGSKESATYTLRIHAAKGDKYAFRVTTTMKGLDTGASGPQELQLAMTVSEELLDVKDGKLTWKQSLGDIAASGKGELVVAGELIKSSQGTVFEMIYTDRGNFVSGKMNGQPVLSEPGGTSNVTFPEKPVKIGDSWTAEQTVSGQKVTMRHTLGAVEQVDGREAYVITSQFQPGSPAVSIRPAKTYIESRTGKPLRGDGAFSFTQGAAKLQAEYTLQRV